MVDSVFVITLTARRGKQNSCTKALKAADVYPSQSLALQFI